jgi:hypothetical protein
VLNDKGIDSDDASNSSNVLRPRILVCSQRNIYEDFLFRCPHREFEDLICQMDSAELLAPRVDRSFAIRYRIAKRIAWYTPLALNPGIQKVKIEKQYDLFFTICGSPVDLLMVNAIKDWNKLARTSVCLVDELWVRELPAYRYLLKILAKFDHVLLYYSQSVKPVGEATGRECSFMPPGIDSILFCPYPEVPRRGIDVYSIGRRAEITHQKLVSMSKETKLFYVYDSVSGHRAIDSIEHRNLLANIAKRSRYLMVNPAMVDLSSVRGNQNEGGNRYFEGCASGAIMVGERPSNIEFDKLFDWPDAVLHLPYNSGDIDILIYELDKQPERQERIRRNNVTHALMRHDWAYRWEGVLKIAGLQPMQGLVERKARLSRLAGDVSASVLSGTGTSIEK